MPNISESEIKVFVDAVTQYFRALTGDAASVRASYLSSGKETLPTLDYTGLITVSGEYRGAVYFTAGHALVRQLLSAMQEPDHSELNLLDAVGEVANTLAGNARKLLGEAMEISVPVTFRGSVDTLQVPVRARPFVIDIEWKRHTATVVVDVERC